MPHHGRMEALNDIAWIIISAAVAVLHFSCAGHALLHKRDPYAALVWVSVCLFVPVGGAMLYILIGFNRVRRRARKIMHRSVKQDGPDKISTPLGTDGELDYFHNHASLWELPAIPRPDGPSAEGEKEAAISPRTVPLALFPPRIRRIAGIGETITGVSMLSGNAVEPLFNGEEAYPQMLKAIKNARRRIWLTTYIFDNDGTGQSFIAALGEAARRGVDVRVLVDGTGTFFTTPRVDKALAAVGVRVARFLPPSLLPPQFFINLRNHRKLLLVDNCTSFTGGMNISDVHLADKEYAPCSFSFCGKFKGVSVARDIHFKIEGPIVNTLQRIFARDWEFCTQEKLELTAGDVCHEIKGSALCRSILDGPDDFFDFLHSILLGVISSAKNSIHIMTPYFLPQRELITALQSAVLRGVDVAVIIPSELDHVFVKWASYNCLFELLRRGVKIYFQPPPFDHSKLLLVDGAYVHLGSANMDPRSFHLNFELTMEVINLHLAARLEAHFKNMRSASREYTLDDLANRPLHTRLRDAVFWLMSPYL